MTIRLRSLSFCLFFGPTLRIVGAPKQIIRHLLIEILYRDTLSSVRFFDLPFIMEDE
jgi:hypothetical protein